MYDCRHNRARIYHLNQKGLYRVIGEAERGLRRPLTLGHAIHRLMVLDVMIDPNHAMFVADTAAGVLGVAGAILGRYYEKDGIYSRLALGRLKGESSAAYRAVR